MSKECHKCRRKLFTEGLYCLACMRDRRAACAYACESRGEKRRNERGHSSKSEFKKKAQLGCEGCGTEIADRLCSDCREIAERHWAESDYADIALGDGKGKEAEALRRKFQHEH